MITISCTEKDIEDFLSINNNLKKYLGLRFLKRQVQTPVGIIDIIAYNNITKRFVIIELKKENLDYKAYFQLQRYRHYIERTERTRFYDGNDLRDCKGLNNRPQRVFDYLLIGSSLSPDLYYNVEHWEPDSDLSHPNSAWYTIFKYDLSGINFRYLNTEQNKIETEDYTGGEDE